MTDGNKILDSGKWFEVLTTHLPMVFYALDSNGVFTLSEGLGLAKLGLKPGQVVGMSAFDIYKDYPDIVEAINRALNGESVILEHNVGEFYIENYFVPQYDNENKVSALICAAIDVSDRVKAERNYRGERTFSEAILRSVPGIFYLYDNDYRLIHWNNNNEEITGYSAAELSIMKLHDWFEGDEEALSQLKNNVPKLDKGETVSVELNLQTKTGVRIPMKFSTIRIVIEDKIYYAGIGLDISELKQTQQKLLEMNKTLEEKVNERTQELIKANQELTDSYEKMKAMQSYLIQSEKMAALGGLVAGVAHEINTPLGVGMTAVTHLMEITREFIDYVKSENVSREELLSYVDELDMASGIIYKNINRASKLVRSFKQVSADQASEPRRPFAVREYLDEILTSLSPRLKKTNISVSVLCDSRLSIDGYPGAFAQIIANLVINSLTHAYGPKDEGNIRISVAALKDMIELVYSDDGVGISEANLSRIFDPFFTTRRGAGGTGLGLTVVYNIVTQQYGGTIQCNSQSGKGTTFVIHLKQGGV